MKKNLTNSDLAFIVYKNLVKILKSKKLYHIFRCNVGNSISNLSVRYSAYCICPKHFMDNPFVAKVFHREASRSPFGEAKNLSDLFCRMKTCVRCDDNISSISDTRLQMIVLEHINNLLHYCVEPTVLDFSLLNSIGNEAFNAVCGELFGEEFVDVTCDCVSDKAKMLMDAQMDFLTSPQGRGFRPEDLGENKKFLEFLKRKGLFDSLAKHIEMVNINDHMDVFDAVRTPWREFEIEDDDPFFFSQQTSNY